MARLLKDKQATLYTFRRCPYAIRARLAIFASGVKVDMCEVDLRHKPQALLDCSAKGTVPVLQFANGDVIDESLDIMHWALAINDPFNWQVDGHLQTITSYLIQQNDGMFKFYLDRYKYAERFPQHPKHYYRQQAALFLAMLTRYLNQHTYLISHQPTFADMAIIPFVRQFAQVDRDWFDASPYTTVRQWLDALVQSPLFLDAIKKCPSPCHNPIDQ